MRAVCLSAIAIHETNPDAIHHGRCASNAGLTDMTRRVVQQPLGPCTPMSETFRRALEIINAHYEQIESRNEIAMIDDGLTHEAIEQMKAITHRQHESYKADVLAKIKQWLEH